MPEPGSFHLLAEKAESNACFISAVQFLSISTVGVAVAYQHQAICPRSLEETLVSYASHIGSQSLISKHVFS